MSIGFSSQVNLSRQITNNLGMILALQESVVLHPIDTICEIVAEEREHENLSFSKLESLLTRLVALLPIPNKETWIRNVIFLEKSLVLLEKSRNSLNKEFDLVTNQIVTLMRQLGSLHYDYRAAILISINTLNKRANTLYRALKKIDKQQPGLKAEIGRLRVFLNNLLEKTKQERIECTLATTFATLNLFAFEMEMHS